MPGGLITQLLLDSPTFGPGIIAGIGAQSSTTALPLIYNNTNFNNYFRDLQTVIDSGDPINHIYDAQLTRAAAPAEGAWATPSCLTARPIA